MIGNLIFLVILGGVLFTLWLISKDLLKDN